KEADERAGVDRDAAWTEAFKKLGARPLGPRAVSAGPPQHPRAVTPLGDRQVPARRAFDNLRSGPPSAFDQLRELNKQHRREGAVIRAVLRRWRPPVTHDRPSSTPRPREGGARMVAASGRDGSGERDDGSGDGGNAGGGGGEPPPQRSGGVRVLE